MTSYLQFKYAIENECGAYYDGSVRDDCWTRSLMNVFTYSEAGAIRKIELFPAMFYGCEVVQIFD